MKLRLTWMGLAAACGLCTVLASPSYAQQEFAGTWILSHSKSTGPLDKYEDVIIKFTDDTEDYVNHITTNDGKKEVAQYQAKADGKEYPEKHGDGSVSYIALTDPFPHTEEAKIYTHDASGQSKLVARFFRVVSPDGKTLYDTLCKADGSLIGFRVFDKSSGRRSATKAAQ
jgi:hypothetical protein